MLRLDTHRLWLDIVADAERLRDVPASPLEKPSAGVVEAVSPIRRRWLAARMEASNLA